MSLLGVSSFTPASAGVSADPQVQDAQSALEEARERMEATTQRLDDLAAAYENAHGHAVRLRDELEGRGEEIVEVQGLIDAAREAYLSQVREAYMNPGVDLNLLRAAGAFLLAPDIDTALHTSAMMSHVAAERAAQVDSMTAAGDRLADDIANEQNISSGTAAALTDLEDLSDAFTEELADAVEDVADAEVALADAEEAAEQRAYLESFTGVIGTVPPPVIKIATVNGGTQEMTCPVGQPNGFVNSWGAPRSGGRRHKGVDMMAAYGMPLFAAADGYIRRVFNNRLGGLSIDLVDVLGNRYYYAHLSAAYVVDGQVVEVGQLIAANGNSGNAIATPPHLHWQFHPADGGPVNPFPLAAALCR